MKKVLIIAEKPSVGRAVADWLSRTYSLPQRSVGRTHIEVGHYVCSWLFGHVLETVEPHVYDMRYKKWSHADLPIIPDVWRLAPKADASVQIAALKSLLRDATEVIGAGDPDPEGQLLQDEFLLWAGCRVPVRRLWMPATDDATLARAWAAMKSNKDYEGFYWSGLARSHADWLYGINLTRGCTLAGQAAGGQSVLSVGRVQTPTLALVVDVEKRIRAFKAVDFYTPFIQLATTPGFQAAWAPDKEDARLDGDGRLTARPVATGIETACKKEGKATVISVTGEAGKENPPLPFSLSTLQEFMSDKHGMGVQDVLKVAQSLYEKKLASYPRTDCDYLPESQYSDADSILDFIGSNVASLPPATELKVALAKANRRLKSGAFSDKKMEGKAHHAITPRPASASDLRGLTPAEQLVLTEISKRYLLQFFPAAEFKNSAINLRCGDEEFRATGKRYTLRGWKDAFGAKEADESGTVLPAVDKGDVLTVAKTGVTASKTKPPKRYTEGTLVAAMKGAHRFVSDPKLKSILRENVGIGTVATQSNTITELFNRKFLELKKKDIYPTALGEALIDALPKQITAPDMTALWQQVMNDIRDTKEAGYTAFMREQETYLRVLIDQIPGWFAGKTMPATGGKKAGGVTIEASSHTCLKCTSPLKRIKGKFGWFFGCSNDACKASFKDVGGVPVEKAAPAAITIDGVSSGSSCPKCKKGVLETRTCGPASKTAGKQFLSCSNFFAKGKAKCDHSVWPK